MVMLKFCCVTRKPFATVLLFNLFIWIATLYHLLSFSHQRAVTIRQTVTAQEQMGVRAVAIQPINRSSPGPNIRPTLRSLESTNEERKSALKRTCNQFGDRIPHLANDTFDLFAKFVIVDKARKILYCPVPKVACTTWIAFFLELHGVNVTSDVHGLERISLVHLNDLATEERETVLRNYTKLLIVRHPFTRILSAFRDKLEPNGSFETTHKNHSRPLYYHRNFWRERIGLKIIAAYRGIAAAERFAETHQEEYDLTFREFTDYIVDFYRSNKSKHTVTRDRHWREIHALCYPCDIEYDFIAKFETLAGDSKNFLVSSGIPNNMTANYGDHRTNSSESKALSQFYDKLPVESIKKLYRKYEMDFRLFGYSPNIVLD